MRRRERGAAAVEFALILPLLLLMIGGVVDFGRAMYAQNIMTNAAREGARMAALGYTDAQITERVRQSMIGFSTGSYTLTWGLVQGAATVPSPAVPCPSNPQPTDRQNVRITSDFNYIILGLVPGFTQIAPQLRTAAEMRCAG